MENINKFEKNPEKEFLYNTEGRLNRFAEWRDAQLPKILSILDYIESEDRTRKQIGNIVRAVINGAEVLVRQKNMVAREEKTLGSGKQDVVSKADIDSQSEIIKSLEASFDPSEHLFIGEEGRQGNEKASSVFLIDSLDGTRAYMLDYDDYSMSVAHEENGQVDFAIVFMPEKGRLFLSYKGQSFYLDEDGTKPVSIHPGEFKDSLLYTDFSDVAESEEINGAMSKFWTQVRHQSPPFKEVRYNSAAFGIPDTVFKNGNAFIGFDLEKVDVAAAAYFALCGGAKVWTSITAEHQGFILVTNGDQDTETMFLAKIEELFPDEHSKMYELTIDNVIFK